MDDVQNADATVVDAPVESESLSDHEAAFSPEAAEPVADAPAADTGRDESGRFKRGERHRAASQRADVDDVPAINAYTKRIKEAEARAGADIARQEGESERAYNLRRRAEVMERYSKAPTTPEAPKPTATPAPSQRRTDIPQAFPSSEQFFSIHGNQDKSFDDYMDERTRWQYAVLRQQEREQDAADAEQRTHRDRASAHLSRVEAARAAKYPDWDAVVTDRVQITGVMQHAILASDKSDDIQYFLGKNPALAAEIFAETLDYSPSAVAATRRYLDSLVAEQRRPPMRPAAAPTGSALTLATTPAPRPPNPVRTGAVTPADDPPGDDASLAAHEKYFGPARR